MFAHSTEDCNRDVITTIYMSNGYFKSKLKVLKVSFIQNTRLDILDYIWLFHAHLTK